MHGHTNTKMFIETRKTYVDIRLLFMAILEKLRFGILKHVESICFYSDAFRCAYN